ncbi:MAG: hypothetical protein K8L99_09615 [Anaerolineae bacterium]|nr:hypothetical protein [Anaerolineae bacterium]
MSQQPAPPPNLPEQDNRPPGYTPYGPRKRKKKPERSGLYLPLWSVVLMLVTVLALAGGVIFLVIYIGGPSYVAGGEPQIVIVTAAVTPTPPQPQIAQPTTSGVFAQPTQPAAALTLEGPTLVPTNTATPTPDVIAVGKQVTVIGAGGVNVRSAAGTTNTINFVSQPNDVLTVVDGPQQVDNLIWWQVQDDSGRVGWAAENDGQQDLLATLRQ